jgi:hypothetical protein
LYGALSLATLHCVRKGLAVVCRPRGLRVLSCVWRCGLCQLSLLSSAVACARHWGAGLSFGGCHSVAVSSDRSVIPHRMWLSAATASVWPTLQLEGTPCLSTTMQEEGEVFVPVRLSFVKHHQTHTRGWCARTAWSVAVPGCVRVCGDHRAVYDLLWQQLCLLQHCCQPAAARTRVSTVIEEGKGAKRVVWHAWACVSGCVCSKHPVALHAA